MLSEERQMLIGSGVAENERMRRSSDASVIRYTSAILYMIYARARLMYATSASLSIPMTYTYAVIRGRLYLRQGRIQSRKPLELVALFYELRTPSAPRRDHLPH